MSERSLYYKLNLAKNKYKIKKFKRFEGNLPYNVNLTMTNQAVFSKFGEPNQKTGGKMVPIAISYDNLGIEFTFITNNWNDYQSPISFICLFEPENNPEKFICAICAKKREKK